MTNIDDFIQWWRGFRDGIGPVGMTKEQMDIVDRKINGLEDLWDIRIPTREEEQDNGWIPQPSYFWPYVNPEFFKKTVPEYPYPRVPGIWCKEGVHIGTPLNQPHVGTPLQ